MRRQREQQPTRLLSVRMRTSSCFSPSPADFGNSSKFGSQRCVGNDPDALCKMLYSAPGCRPHIRFQATGMRRAVAGIDREAASE